MLFNSLQFLVFFMMVTGGCFVLRGGLRRGWLLLASCYFYMVCFPKYIVVLFALILIDYFAGLLLECTQGGVRKAVLWGSLSANVGLLAFFKYFNFAALNFAQLGHFFGHDWTFSLITWPLPIGLSFHTFQSMSYTIEVYKGRQKAEANLGIYALYVLFFPQLVAGPIERPQNILHQLHEEKTFDTYRAASGLKLIIWGLIKKSIIADQLSGIVAQVYGYPYEHYGWHVLLASYAFAVEIFCDFSGYSDIARGAARVMGYELMQNFDQPYSSRSIAEFWRRWHISLSTWFRDYVYIPLGGNRVSLPRNCLNIIIVFALSGLWHGANWHYIIWGGLHGVYLVLSILTKDVRNWVAGALGLGTNTQIRRTWSWFITFHLVVLTWVLFRAQTTHHAFVLLRNLFYRTEASKPLLLEMNAFEAAGVAGAILLMELVHLWQRREHIEPAVRRAFPYKMRWAVYGAAALAIVVLGKFDSQSFIYFQF